MAGDQESYSISAKGNNQMSVMLPGSLAAGLDWGNHAMLDAQWITPLIPLTCPIPFWDVPIYLSTLKIAYVIVNYFTGLLSNIATFN